MSVLQPKLWKSIGLIFAVIGLLAAIALVGGYFYLLSLESWGSIGTLSGYDARPEFTEAAIQRRITLHEWAKERGFQEATMPADLKEKRAGDWQAATQSPEVYSAMINGNVVLLITWPIHRNGVNGWQGEIYYRDMPQDMGWFPGGQRGKPVADELFRAARELLQRSNDEA